MQLEIMHSDTLKDNFILDSFLALMTSIKTEAISTGQQDIA